MDRRLISTHSPFETEFAYSRAVVQGDWCFVAGTTGYDYATMTMPADAADQARNALKTIEDRLEEAGFAMSDVVRAVYYVTDASVGQAIAPALRGAFRDVRPAATMIVASLLRPDMKVEIEVTALRHSGGR